MKGIKWGINQSIDANKDLLLLTSSGKDPNIISYRKAMDTNTSSKNNLTHNRLASAKISMKPPTKLVNSQPKLNFNVELNDRVDSGRTGLEASPNTIYKSTVLEHVSLKETCNQEESE